MLVPRRGSGSTPQRGFRPAERGAGDVVHSPSSKRRWAG